MCEWLGESELGCGDNLQKKKQNIPWINITTTHLQGPLQFSRSPTFETHAQSKHDGETQQVVVVDSVIVLKVEVLNPLAHIENICRRREAVGCHPEIA